MVGTLANRLRRGLLIFAALMAVLTARPGQAQAAKPAAKAATTTKSAGQTTFAVERGKAIFTRDCSFCHGRDAAGGESGPDLTRSRLVARDVRGDRVRAVVQNGRPEKGMPPFSKLSPLQINDVIAFIRNQTKLAEAR